MRSHPRAGVLAVAFEMVRVRYDRPMIQWGAELLKLGKASTKLLGVLGESKSFVENPILGNEPVYGQPIRLSETPGSVRSPAPTLGQHTREVLEELLAMRPDEIDALAAEDVLR